MTTTLEILCAVLAVPFLGLGLAKVLAVASMRERAAEVNFSANAYRAIGTAEVAAAVALLSARWFPRLAILALAGLALLLIGAAGTHIRQGDGLAKAMPALVLLVVVCSVGMWAYAS